MRGQVGGNGGGGGSSGGIGGCNVMLGFLVFFFFTGRDGGMKKYASGIFF